MTINTNPGILHVWNWNENNVKDLSRTNWRASLVPAAAVIPAPIAYIKVVAVETLVVGCFVCKPGEPLRRNLHDMAVYKRFCSMRACAIHFVCVFFLCGADYFEKIRVFKAGKF